MTTALSPLRPIKAPGLFDAAKAGTDFATWDASKGGSEAMPSIAPAQVSDSMAEKVTALTSKDSPLNQAARTEGLKMANRRGLLNSSMAVGAAQDSVIKNALPIASQDAAQDFQRNQDARAFEYGMAAQGDAQDFQSQQAALDRALQQQMQTQSLSAAEAAQIRDIASREGIAAADRALQQTLQSKDIEFRSGEGALDRALQQRLASWNLASSDRNAAAQFISNTQQMYTATVQSIMANTNLDAGQRSQQMASAQSLYNRQMGLVEELYHVELTW